MALIILIGRILFSSLFILSSFSHFSSKTIQYAQGAGVPFASVLVPISGIIALLGGISILIGFKARWGAWLIVIFLIPITLYIHRFWGIDSTSAQLQVILFMKNIALLGAALIIAYFGSGPMSITHEKLNSGKGFSSNKKKSH